MGLVITPEDLQAAQAFHGNVCLGLPLGLRAGWEALAALEVPRSADKELTAIVEVAPEQFSHCFVDGIQWITGCTVGKNNLQFARLGKFALTVVDVESQQAVRVSFRAEFLEEFLQWPPVAAKSQHQKGYHPAPGEVAGDIQSILDRPVEEMFRVQRFATYPVIGSPMDWTHVRCTDCGELVIGSYAHQSGDGAWCPACWDHHVHSSAQI